ncbi:hypothetical protein [Nocardioides pinisoli]|uniref:Ig-like domain-containing protein n=1 Tax=Nocardioides pinisoli TaxID=2950279 RepID=A0ABT1KVN8_9ACTN|nr:hypothetical protein [Nocardioides pinisoli]MCP3421830.1 hypothetical protein [Nocardioides pinisoli]
MPAWITVLLVTAGVALAPLPASAAPGAPVITGHPAATVETPYAAFTFLAAGATSYECRVFAAGTPDGTRPAYDDCGQAGSHRTEALADGDWTFEVRGRDEGGTGPSATRDWTVTSDPVVQWIVEPTGSYSARTVAATFTAAGATSFECRLDDGGFAACGNGQRGTWTSPMLAAGPHVLQVRASDAGGPGPVATATFTIADPLGITWLARPQGTVDARALTARFTASGAVRYECRLVRTDPEPDPLPGFSTCGSGRNGHWRSELLPDGAYRLDVRAVDGVDPGPTAAAEFVVAASSPLVWVSRPQGTIEHRAVTAMFRATGVSGFECRVHRTDPVPTDVPDFSACGNGRQGYWRSAVLEDGAWRLEVRPADPTGPRPVSGTEFVVSRPLAVSWGARPTGTIAGSTYAATFSAEGAISYECRLDAGAWGGCGTARNGYETGAPGDGEHVLEVRAVDEHGPGPSSSTTFTMLGRDAGATDLQVTSGPSGTTGLAWAAFSWAARDAACFRWELDGDGDLSDAFCYHPASYGDTASMSASFANLADGDHLLRIQAQAADGTFGDVITRPFTVDTAAGTRVRLVTGPGAASTVESAWAAFSWTAEQARCFRWQLDGDDDLSDAFCFDPGSYGSAAWQDTFTALPDGVHVLKVQAESLGGTPGPVTSHSFTVATGDVVRPRITSGPAQDATVEASWAALGWEADQAQCYRWELDGDGDLTNAFCFDPSSYGAAALSSAFDDLADGEHTLRVQASSLGGTYGPVVTRTFLVDTAGAVRPRIIAGPGEDATIPSAWAAFAWTSEQARCLRWEMDGDGDLSDRFCYDPASYGSAASAAAFDGLGDGTHVLRVQAESVGGTPGPTITRTFRVNSGPWVTVSSRPRQVLPSSTAAFAWSAPGAECYRWEVDGDGDLADRFCYNPASYGAQAHSDSISGLADGAHTLRVQAQSTGGAFGPVTPVQFTVETKAPETTITGGPTGFVSSRAASFTFDADETATFECSVDGGAYTACGSPLELDELEQGVHSLSVRAVDLAGKTDATPATRSWTVDTVDPTVIDLDGPSGTIVDPDFVAVLTFQADEPATFECRLVPAAFAPCAPPTSYTALPDGQYRFEVRAVDRAGNRSAVAFREWTLVTDPPETALTSAPSGLVRQTSATVAFTSPDSPVTFECEVDGAAWAACTSPLQLTGLAQGDHTVRVRAVLQGSLRDPSPEVATWTVDTIGPTTTITSGPSGTVGAGPRTLTFLADEPATFTCVVDGGTPYTCTSPESIGALGSGAHTFTVRATDEAGNVGSDASRSWTVDAEPPVVTITGRPAAVTSQTSGTVSFTVDDPSATVECRLDGGAWSPCTSPVTRTGLAEGEHVLEVRATDAAGNASDPAAAQWRVDTTAPVVAITSAPVLPTSSSTVTIGFTVSEPADASCRVDGGPFTPCSSPHAFADLSDGVHRVEVRATDAAGNTGTPAGRDVTVDTVAPRVTITGGPADTVPQTDARFTFTVDESPVTTRCSLDGAAFTLCDSPVTYAGLDQGVHTVRIQATDAASNTGPVESRTWTVDTPEPDTTIDSAPPAVSNDRTPAFAFSSDTVGATFECRLDDATVWTSCASGLEVGPLGDGPHTFRVRAVSDGLTDPTPDAHTWVVDATAPVVTVTQRPVGLATLVGSRFVFTVGEEATVECQVDGTWRSCASPFDPVLTDGSHTVRIRATDAAGNVGQTDPMTWTLDGTEPDVVITSGPSGDHTSRTATYTFTVDDPTATVECLLDGGTWTPCSSPRTFTGLEDGPHSFSVRATDPAGNRGAEGRSFFVDATAPVVTFTSGPPAVTTSRVADLAFRADDPQAVLRCRLGTAALAPCTSPVQLTGLADGTWTFHVEATDGFGNFGTATRTWVVDNTPPTVTITSGPSGTVTSNDVSFSFTADDSPATYECRLDAAAFAPCTSPRAYDDLAAGAHRFEVRATNGADVTGPIAFREFTVAVQGDPSIAVTVQARTTAGAALTATGLGDDFVVRASLTNSGPVASDATVLTVPLSSDLTLAGALPERCASPDADGPVTCTIGVVGAGATTVVDLRLDASFTCTVHGDSGNQSGDAARLLGTAGDDVICGGGGADEILGRGGNDVVWGYGPTGSVATGASVSYGPGARTASAPVPATVGIGGPDGGDTITTAQGDDTVRAGAGADTVSTGAGRDTVAAEDGNDRVDTGTGPGTASGGDGADTLTGGPEGDGVDGGAGDDTINAGAGGNTVRGGAGDDRISASSGTILAEEGNDTVTGTTGSVDAGPGNDSVSSTTGPVLGGAGSDTITGTSETVRGGPGNDTVSGTSGTVAGDDGNDVITGTPAADLIDGGNGDDAVAAGAGDDQVAGGDGTDTLRGDSGNDTIGGSFGNDIIWGGDGADRLSGDTGDDTINGDAGNDRIEGDNGEDTLRGGGGADIMDGGILDDDLHGDAGDDDLVGGDGRDLVNGDVGDDDVAGGRGSDRLWGEDGDDLLDGGQDSDKILGGGGHDYLEGGANGDELNGGLGRDVVRGGGGADELDGGGTSESKREAPRDHWNRLYGDDGQDICHFGPGTGIQMTNYRDATCELRKKGDRDPGRGWLNGSAIRLDRGRNLRAYPG